MPREGLQTLEEYQQNISEIKEILRGNISQISKHLYEEMQKLAGELRFEEAQKIKEKYEVIENYRSKSTVVTPMLHILTGRKREFRLHQLPAYRQRSDRASLYIRI